MANSLPLQIPHNKVSQYNFSFILQAKQGSESQLMVIDEKEKELTI